MSGYDPLTGVFEISTRQVTRWLRKDTDRFGDVSSMEASALLLKEAGLDVISWSSVSILVRNHQAPIWEALSGLPADPNHPADPERLYHTPRYTATRLGILLVPQMSAVDLNLQFEAAGLIRKGAGGKDWKLTKVGKVYGEQRTMARGTPFIQWTLDVLDHVGLAWPKPAKVPTMSSFG